MILGEASRPWSSGGHAALMKHDGVMVIGDPRRLAVLANAYPDSAAFWDDGADSVQHSPRSAPNPRVANSHWQGGIERV